MTPTDPGALANHLEWDDGGPPETRAKVDEGVRGLMSPATCPECSALVDDPSDGCERCEVFRCPRCTRWVSWDLGCGDTLLCDECWAELEGEREP